MFIDELIKNWARCIFTISVFLLIYAKYKKKTIVHFKRLGSRHIHTKIKLEKAMNGMDRILCKTDLILIRRHTYKCNTFSDVDFGVFSKSAYEPLWYSQFQ